MTVSICTLISFYGPKQPGFARLLADCQQRVAEMLGGQFRPYDHRQVHCTIASLDRAGNAGLANLAFEEFRGQRVEMDVPGLLEFLKSAEPMEIQMGGFAPGATPFLSRGQTPYQRSFSLQDGKAVIIGWPIDRSGGQVIHPPRLEALRRSLRRFGILHRYHKTDADIDNDFYCRIGLYDPAGVSATLQAEVEHRLREFLAARHPLYLSLGPGQIACAQSDHHTLPPATTPTVSIDSPDCDPQAIFRLFGWGDAR